MRLNRAGRDFSQGTENGLLQQRLVGLSSGNPRHVDPDRAGQDTLQQQSRERLKAGGHNNRRQAMRPGDAEAKARASKTWHLWVVFDILLLLLIVPLVVAVPVVLDCRQKRDHPSFFAGQPFEGCIRDGIAERWSILDSRLKMIARGSGQ